MTPEVFAEWFRRQGHRVVRTESSYWVEAAPRIFQAFPYHWLISPSQAELDQLLREHRAMGLRYSTLWKGSSGAASYHVVYTEHEYPFSFLPLKTRTYVRRILQRGGIEQISFQRLAREGWRLRADTLKRQGREGAETPQWWERLCISADGLPGFEAWAVVIEGQLAAALIAFICDGCCTILYQQSRTEYLPLRVNNALTYIFTNQVLSRPNHPWVFYGLHSLDAPPSVDEFKFLMGYIAKPVRQRVVFHPWLRLLMNPLTHALLKAGARLMPGQPALSKAEGMLRFYLQGRLPLEKQPLPPPLQPK